MWVRTAAAAPVNWCVGAGAPSVQVLLVALLLWLGDPNARDPGPACVASRGTAEASPEQAESEMHVATARTVAVEGKVEERRVIVVVTSSEIYQT
jgi:hypothetical protein